MFNRICQGIDITNRNEKLSRWNYVSKEIIEHCVKSNNLKFLAEKLKIYKLFFEDCEYIKKQFFQKEASYNFSKECWIKNETNVTNKFLLQFIINCIKNYTDEIYIRDVSFLGFPSVYIVIPKMSFIFEYDEDRIQTRKNLYDWIQMENLEEKYSIQKLVEALEYMKKHCFFQDILISEFPKEYLLFLCSILEENVENIEHFGNIIIDANKSNKLFNKDFTKNVEIIIKYFNLKK